jgi:hypothetical protein
MDPRPRRSSVSAVTALVLAAILAGCGSGDPGGTATDGAATPAPSTSGAPPASGGAPITQTDTAWGRIWDDLPAGFPRYPGGTAADDATPGPVSAVYAIPEGDPAEIADWLQTSLESATYSTEALSGPLEDGSFVLDSVGDAGCRIETTIAPLGDLILVTVLYGAACPA